METHEREDDDDAPGEAHSLEIVIVDEPWKHIMSTRCRSGDQCWRGVMCSRV